MEDFKYVFGPVPSRRMGLSVGISPIADGHCNYSCIYCQLGRTRKMTNKREEFYPVSEVVAEFREYLKEAPDFDVVTIVGEGEPLLYSGLGQLIRELKELTDKPIAVITNGALLADAEVREQLMVADIVLPSFDGADEQTYKKINRPFGNIKYEEVCQGFIDFSKKYQGQLWIEMMIVKGINDTEKDYNSVKEKLSEVDYDKIYINTPVRPPAEGFVEEPTRESIDLAIDILGGISIENLVSEGFSSEIEDDYEAVLSIIKRHPMNQFEIKTFISGRGNKDVDSFFERIDKDQRIEKVDYKNYSTYRFSK